MYCAVNGSRRKNSHFIFILIQFGQFSADKCIFFKYKESILVTA